MRHRSSCLLYMNACRWVCFVLEVSLDAAAIVSPWIQHQAQHLAVVTIPQIHGQRDRHGRHRTTEAMPEKERFTESDSRVNTPFFNEMSTTSDM
eukprot:m.112272 g.112272  ORF g.112272 m.112272 type:complete len:94 (-) comp15320_c0_seq2:430-711(-)